MRCLRCSVRSALRKACHASNASSQVRCSALSCSSSTAHLQVHLELLFGAAPKQLQILGLQILE